MFQTILVPVDGSANARQAVELASDLAARFGARLVLLHVCYGRRDIPESLRHKAEARLAGLSERSSQVKDTTGQLQAPAALGGEFFLAPPASPEVVQLVGTMVLDEAKAITERKSIKRVLEAMAVDGGDAAERILDCAKREAADLIVMGSRGFGGLQGLVLGSTSHKVNQLAACACIAIRRRGAKSISSFSGLEPILVATDGSKQADAAVTLAADIAALYGAHLSLVHVLLRDKGAEELRQLVERECREEPPFHKLADVTALPVGVVIGQSPLPRELRVEVLQALGGHVLERAKRLCQARGAEDVSLDLLDGDPAEQILRRAEQENVELIVIGRRGLGHLEGLLQGSVSSKVCHLAKCTTVSVH